MGTHSQAGGQCHLLGKWAGRPTGSQGPQHEAVPGVPELGSRGRPKPPNRSTEAWLGKTSPSPHLVQVKQRGREGPQAAALVRFFPILPAEPQSLPFSRPG